MSHKAINIAAAAAFGLAAIRWVVGLRQRKPGELTLGAGGAKQTESTKAWLLVIQSKFKSIEDRDALLSHVQPVAVESARNEPETLGFQIAISDSDPLSVLIFERFTSKEAWLGPHKASRVFKELKTWQAAAGIEVETVGQSYNETEFGYLTPTERTILAQRSPE